MRPITAADVMNPNVLTVQEDMTIEELASFLIENEISGAPVEDAGGRLTGVVSVTDLALSLAKGTGLAPAQANPDFFVREWGEPLTREEVEELQFGEAEVRVREIMTPHVYSVDAETPIPEVAETLINSHLHRLVVTRDERAVGILTTSDLLGLLVREPEYSYQVQKEIPMAPRWKYALFTVLAILLLTAAAPAAEPLADPDLGILNARQAEPGLLIAGQPTAQQLKAAGKAGYRTVFDLRSQAEDRGFDEEKVAGKAKMAYTNVEVMPDALTQSKVLYFLMMLREAERPVLLHCSTGNRAAALYYSWLVLEKNLPEAQALEQARAAGLRDPLLGDVMRAIVADIKKSQRPAD